MQALSNAKGLLAVGKVADVRVFTAAGTLVAGQTVAFDESQTGEARCQKVVVGGAEAHVIGIALEAATSGNEVRVIVGGYVEGVTTDGNVASGNALAAGAAGVVLPYTAAMTVPIIGVALETDTGTLCDVYLYRLIP